MLYTIVQLSSWCCVTVALSLRCKFIHLLPSLEGDMMICSTQKIHVAEGEARHEFSGLNKCWSPSTNWAINCLSYRKLKHDFIRRRTLCRETWPWDMTSEGRREDLSSLRVTTLNQSYFFIYLINYIRYNNLLWSIFILDFVLFYDDLG